MLDNNSVVQGLFITKFQRSAMEIYDTCPIQNGEIVLLWRFCSFEYHLLKGRGPVCGPTEPFLYSQHSKLKITNISQPFVACPALQAPIQESHGHLMAPKWNSRLTQDLRKAATETGLVTLEQHTVEYDSVVGQ